MRLVGDSIEQFHDGDLILLGSDLPHMWRSDAKYFTEKKKLHVEAIALHFKKDFWGMQFLYLPECKALKELLEKSKRGIKITGKIKPEITGKMEAILKADDSERIELLINILNTIARSKNYVYLSGTDFTKSYDIINTEKINLIYNYTFDNFRQKISIVKAAEIACLSQHSFCRYFKSRTLKTYMQFLKEIRIGYACKLLIENKLSISQIACNCGYNNLSNFNRQFKLITGKTPLEYSKEFLI
jgi:AraC-like DNA-binding protein